MNPMLKKTLLIFFLPFCCSLGIANPAQKTLPYIVKADQVHMDAKKGVTVYLGHVNVVQGATVLNGEKAITYEGQHHKIDKLVAYGHPATYQTLVENQKTGTQTPFYAEANEIIYEPEKAMIYLRDKAFVRDNGRELRSNKIDYNMALEQIYSAKQENTRTVIVIPASQG